MKYKKYSWEFEIKKRTLVILAIILSLGVGTLCIGWGMAQLRAQTASVLDVGCLAMGLLLYWTVIRYVLWGEWTNKNGL